MSDVTKLIEKMQEWGDDKIVKAIEDGLGLCRKGVAQAAAGLAIADRRGIEVRCLGTDWKRLLRKIYKEAISVEEVVRFIGNGATLQWVVCEDNKAVRDELMAMSSDAEVGAWFKKRAISRRRAMLDNSPDDNITLPDSHQSPTPVTLTTRTDVERCVPYECNAVPPSVIDQALSATPAEACELIVDNIISRHHDPAALCERLMMVLPQVAKKYAAVCSR